MSPTFNLNVPGTLLIACDHGGFELKEVLKEKLLAAAVPVEDLGVQKPERVDYPDFAAKVAQRISQEKASFGLLICGTGQGMAMTANRFAGVRAAVVGDCFSAQMARAHNDANVLCLGGRVLGTELAWQIVQTFLSTDFEGGRHAGRIQKIHAVEENLRK